MAGMRIMTFNANGIRSAQRKGFFRWLADQDVDVACIQETKAQRAQLEAAAESADYFPAGYACRYCDAEKKGYSGTAMYCRRPPQAFRLGLGWDPADSEGRWIAAEYDGLVIVSLYMPSGSSGPERQAVKYAFMERLAEALGALRESGREVICCADWNICHHNIDLKNWRANQKNSGFLPAERAWLDRLFGELGYLDAFRLVNPHAEQYTWWSNRGRARDNNVGWRLDYHAITPGLREAVTDARIHAEPRFSDHAPLIIEYAPSLAERL